MFLTETEITEKYIDGKAELFTLYYEIKDSFDNMMNRGNPLRYFILSTIINWFIKTGSKKELLIICPCYSD